MENCRIVGAIALPIKSSDKTTCVVKEVKKTKNYRKPLTVKLGALLFKAYADKSRKNNSNK